MNIDNDTKLINSKMDRLPEGTAKNSAGELYKTIFSNKKNAYNKSKAITKLNAIFVKHGMGSFFNSDGHRADGKSTGGKRSRRVRRTFRKKRTVHKTRRLSRRA